MGGQEQTVHSGSGCCIDPAEHEVRFQAWDKPHVVGRVAGGQGKEGKSEVRIYCWGHMIFKTILIEP